jgi:hypothetical protein
LEFTENILRYQEFQHKREEGFAIIDIRRADEWEDYGITVRI